MVRRPEEYRWSSHRAYLGLISDEIVDTELVLGMFSKGSKRGRRLYREYMREEEEKGSKEEFYRTVDQRILGDEEFVESLRERVKDGIAAGRRRHGVSLGEIGRRIEEVFGIGLDELKGRGKDTGVMEGRRLFSLTAREYGYKGKEIAAFLGKDPASVTGYLWRGQDLHDKKERLNLLLDGVRKNINI
jgi:hypothetical protein